MSSTDAAIRVFVSGDRAQVGKSTVCLGLIGALLRHGFAASDIAYIKPATQCEKPQLVTKFCRRNGIACAETSPIVFYSGFTREFLKGNTDSTEQLLATAQAKVQELSRGKKIVVIDGVGYPGVGSICGVSNAAVAKALQAPVVLIGKRGVGDAVDSFNLNACYFEHHGVAVLGAIFNRLPPDGYYSLAKCRESVSAYFRQYQPHKRVYGFMPEMAPVEASADDDEATASVACDADAEALAAAANKMTAAEVTRAANAVETFAEHVDVLQLLEDIKQHQGATAACPSNATDATASAKRALATESSDDTSSSEATKTKRSRAEIQEDAWASGAAGGCRA